MPAPWDSISQMPWFQNMMRSSQGSMPGNMMSQPMNRGGQQFGNMRSNLAGMSPNPPAIGNQPPPNPPVGTLAPSGAPPPNPPAGLGAPSGIMTPFNPSAGLGGSPTMQTGPVDQTPTLPGAGPQVGNVGPMAGPPTQPGPGQASPQVGPTSGMAQLGLPGGASFRPYKSGGRVEPTDGQKKTGNYKKRHITVHGLDISIENEKGSTRSGTGKDGKKWSVKMPYHYGYLKRTEGADGDHVDVCLGPHLKSPKVFVVNQHDAERGGFDEHKVMLGFGSEAQARNHYLRGFSDGKGARRLGGLKEMSIDQFKNWLKKSDLSKPAKAA